ncbi:MAG: SPOR domain-containing protein [Treponema sp.]|jgi:hypothetical protein|nr:SPOR domain-containing protein [Treponema sp.]
MRRFLFFISLLFFPVLCFAQKDTPAKIIGKIPALESKKLYQIQVGAFKNIQNAERAFAKLKSVSFNPIYDNHLDFTRVIITGISARDIESCLNKIKPLGFGEIWIKEDSTRLPISTAALPAAALTEIGFCTIKIGATKNVADLARNKNIVQWLSSTPSSFTVNANGDVSGVKIGNGFISINEHEYISIAVVPAENFYIVPASQSALLPPNSRTGIDVSKDVTEYRTEPTFRLAYRFNNKGEDKGASGKNGGVDILARGENYKWLWTTFYQGGWFYDLNGNMREMINGYQKDKAAGIELMVKPEFVYDNDVPYLQLKHLLHNMNNFTVTDQRFGASADVMIHDNDNASLLYKPYGAYMTDSESNPTIELMFIGLSGDGITPVDTLWLGRWGSGTHLDYIYDDARIDVIGHDTAIGFSYKNIELKADESKEFIIRFTLARRENQE